MTGIEIKPKVYSQTIKQVQVLVEKVELFSLTFGIFVTHVFICFFPSHLELIIIDH